MSSLLKIASWNINSIRVRMEIVEKFLVEASPDILCLQETKVRDCDFPEGMFRRLGYNHIIICGQQMHHGVAIASRVPIREDARFDWQANGEARHVGVRLDCGIRLENVYVPAGGDVPDRAKNPKFGQKLDFIERMTRWSEACGAPTLLVGDLNVAPLECDVWSHKQLINEVSHTPIEVEALTRLQHSNSWIDLGRRFVPRPEPVHCGPRRHWTERSRPAARYMWATADVGATPRVWASAELDAAFDLVRWRNSRLTGRGTPARSAPSAAAGRWVDDLLFLRWKLPTWKVSLRSTA